MIMYFLVASCILVGVYSRSPPLQDRCLELLLQDKECGIPLPTEMRSVMIKVRLPFHADEKIMDHLCRILTEFESCIAGKYTDIEDKCPQLKMTVLEPLRRLTTSACSTYKPDLESAVECLNKSNVVRMSFKTCAKKIQYLSDPRSMVEDIRSCITALNSCTPTLTSRVDKFITENKSDLETLISLFKDLHSSNFVSEDYMSMEDTLGKGGYLNKGGYMINGDYIFKNKEGYLDKDSYMTRGDYTYMNKGGNMDKDRYLTSRDYIYRTKAGSLDEDSFITDGNYVFRNKGDYQNTGDYMNKEDADLF